VVNPQLEALEALTKADGQKALKVLHALLSEGSPKEVWEVWESLPEEAAERLFYLAELLRYTDWSWVAGLLEAEEERVGLKAPEGW